MRKHNSWSGWFFFFGNEHILTLILYSIAADPDNLAAINALAGMGILTGDDNLVDAALAEILSLPLERRHELDPRRDVDYLLLQHHLGQVGSLILMLVYIYDASLADGRRQSAFHCPACGPCRTRKTRNSTRGGNSGYPEGRIQVCTGCTRGNFPARGRRHELER